MSLPPQRPRAQYGSPREWIRIAVIGTFLAGILYFTFFYEPAPPPGNGSPPVIEESTPIPTIDPKILALAVDRTRADRLVTETEPLKHLLEKSLQVTPAVAARLQMPKEPIPPARLRANPDAYRGRYLWYKGRLEYLSEPQAGHPVPGYDYYEGRLVTGEGEPVLFAFSVPPPPDLKVGDWVRMEGYLLKLRDAHLPVPLDEAPMLVGPELFPAYADWNAVEKLDPAVLGRVHDGEWRDGRLEEGADMGKMLSESQDVPLWHLAGYVRHHAPELTAEQRAETPAFATREQFEKFRRGEIPRGTPMRLFGTFVQGRIMPARVNPLGIEAWSEVWIQVHDLAGKTIPIWIPDRIRHDWQRNQDAVCIGYFFRLYSYRTQEGDVRWTPLFVAAGLDHFELSDQAMTNAITAAFVVLIAVVGTIFFWMARRDRKLRERHEKLLLERRRRRRQAGADTSQQPCAP